VLYDIILATITKPKGLQIPVLMIEQSFSDFGTRSIFTPTQEEGKNFSLHGQQKTSFCWQQMRQHLIVSTGVTAAMLHGPPCTGHSTILHPQPQNMSCIYLNI
jgi:hypothetical protein